MCSCYRPFDVAWSLPSEHVVLIAWTQWPWMETVCLDVSQNLASLDTCRVSGCSYHYAKQVYVVLILSVFDHAVSKSLKTWVKGAWVECSKRESGTIESLSLFEEPQDIRAEKSWAEVVKFCTSEKTATIPYNCQAVNHTMFMVIYM